MDLEDVETAANLVQEAAHPDANIIFGATFDASLQDEIRVTVIATGFEEAPSGTAPADAASGAAATVSGAVRPISVKERPQGLFTGAAEKAAAAPVAASPVVPPPMTEERPASAPADGSGEDPFDSIFKIFNAK